jgi:hypothetical protein
MLERVRRRELINAPARTAYKSPLRPERDAKSASVAMGQEQTSLATGMSARKSEIDHYLVSRYSFGHALVGRSQDSPRIPTPGTNV